MERIPFCISLLVLCLLTSCSGLRRATDCTSRMELNNTTLNRLAGKYKPVSVVPNTKIKTDLAWNIFDRGYNPKTKNNFIEIEMAGKNKLAISYWDSTTLIKSKVFTGKIKNNYFVFERKYLIIPAIFVNLFRNRAFRIGLLPNGNLITDYKQIHFGSFYVILPDWGSTKEFGVEYPRLYE